MLQMLIADNDEGDRQQIRRALQQSELSVVCTETRTLSEALEACEHSAFDCAILDYHLPGQSGLDGIRTLHERLPHMPLIMVTGRGSENVAAEALRLGASGYMGKKQIDSQTL